MSLQSLQTQTVTYWAPAAYTGYASDKSYDTPVQCNARYQRVRKTFVDGQGTTYTSEAIVYPDISMQLGGFVALGTYTDSDPRSVNNAFQIRNTQESSTPDLSITVYKVILS